MDWWLFIWIALMGIIPPAVTSFITSAIVGYLLYLYGKAQGEKQKEIVTKEIKTYIKGEFLKDIGDAFRDQLNGVFGPVARGASAESKAIAAQYAQQNPGITQLLTSVAAKGAARWLGKQLGVPRDVVDTIGGSAPFIPFQLGKKQDDLLKPVELPHP